MKFKVVDPDFRWIEVITTAAFCALLVVGMAVFINYGLKVDDVLGVGGAIAGAGLGAWLAASAARASARVNAENEVRERHKFVRDVLSTVREEIQRGTTAATESTLVDFNVSFGENQLSNHMRRMALALAMLEDANAKVGADFRALRALHTALRSIRQTEQAIADKLGDSRSGDFGRDAMRLVQTSRNTMRMSIELALRRLDGHDEQEDIAGLFGVNQPANSTKSGANEGVQPVD